MVTIERRPGQAAIIDKQDLGPIRIAAAQTTEPEFFQPIDFLNYHHPVLGAEAAALGFEHGRVFLDSKKNKTYAFLTAASADGAVERYVQQLKLSKDEAEKILKIAWYFICTDTTVYEVAALFDYASTGLRDRFTRFVKFVHENSSPQIQEQFPIGTLGLQRILTERRRNKISAVQNGHRAAVKSMFDSNIKDPNVIAQRLGIPKHRVVNLLVLIRKSVNEKTKITRAREMMRRLDDAQTVTEFAGILRGVPDSRLRRDSNFISIRKFLKKYGFLYTDKHIRHLVNKLMYAEEPHRRVYYWGKDKKGNRQQKGSAVFILTKQEERILRIIDASDILRKLLVSNSGTPKPRAAAVLDNSQAAM